LQAILIHPHSANHAAQLIIGAALLVNHSNNCAARFHNGETHSTNITTHTALTVAKKIKFNDNSTTFEEDNDNLVAEVEVSYFDVISAYNCM